MKQKEKLVTSEVAVMCSMESENILLKSRNLAERLSNFDMSSYNKERTDSNEQNCKCIVLF